MPTVRVACGEWISPYTAGNPFSTFKICTLTPRCSNLALMAAAFLSISARMAGVSCAISGIEINCAKSLRTSAACWSTYCLAASSAGEVCAVAEKENAARNKKEKRIPCRFRITLFENNLFAFIPINLPILHHEFHFFHHLDVFERVAI